MGRRRWRQDPGGPQLAAPAGLPLLPLLARRTAAAWLVACVTVTTALGALFFHQDHPSALDNVVDSRIQSALGRHQNLIDRLVNLGRPAPVAIMTVVLAVACLATRRVRGALLATIATP